jgi:DNA-binding NarL/FixJ family response regulator
MTTRVLVVDDHPLFRDALARLVASTPDLEVAALAGDGPDAIAAVESGGIDVVLMDLNLPSLSGVEATARIGALAEPPAVLVVTMVDDDDAVLAAMQAGARGYILKGASAEEIAAAIRTVATGGAVFGAGIAARVLTLTSSAQPTDASSKEGLTPREREVLTLLAEGSSNKQIALALGLSLKTVQNYVSRILDKLQVTDRTQAALRAQKPHRRIDAP